MASDGETYERAAIERWLAEKQAAVAEAGRALGNAGDHERARRTIAAGVVPAMGYSRLENLVLHPVRIVRRMTEQWQSREI